MEEGDLLLQTINARGPNINCSFRNPISSRNFERPRYAESVYDQRSIYYRRETSPMSIQSACDMRQRNLQHYAGMSSRQSLFNGRGGSPMSLRTIDSSASVSAADIVFAINNGKFNRNDWKLIREATLKFTKQRGRKRFEKRRNMRLHLKSRRSGDDSGDQASDSSVSSDDHRSVKTYKENMSSSRSTRTDLTDFRNTYRDRNMPKDGLDNVSQNTFKNKFSVGSSSINGTQNLNNTIISNQSNSMPSQKDRFRNGFLLPSQRFNRSVASSVIMEDSEIPHKNTRNNMRNNCQSSEEEIFSEITIREKSTFDIAPQRKRRLDSENESKLPDSKRSRVASPSKNNTRAPPTLKKINPSNSVNLSNSFHFAKPSMPVRKSKNKVQKQLIAKSSQPLTSFLEPMPNLVQEKVQVLDTTNSKEKSNDNLTVDQSDTTQNNDVSSRPSFIKRKLFTQNLDVVETANLNTDATNSPQSSVYTLQKEKNKARKLVTNQSCLNREVQDDNNLLDLIHEIVPPDRINLSNQTTINQAKNDVNNKKDKPKWDVSSVISMCNEDDASDTYTDEEIFKADNTVKHTTKDKDINTKADPIDKVVSKTIIPQDSCKVVMKKLDNNNTLQKQIVNQNFTLTHNNNTKNSAKNSVKTFWDTDFESDEECHTVLPRSHVLDNLKKANATLDTTKQDFKKPTGYVGTEISKKSLTTAEVPKQLNNSLMNNTTFNNTHKLNARTLSVRSHRTSQKKKCCNETCTSETVSKSEIPVDKKKNNSKQPVKKNVGTTKSKDNVQNKHPTDVSKSKSNTENEKNSAVVRSNKKSKSKVEKSSSVNNQNSNPEPQNNKTVTKRKAENLKENTQVEKACKKYHKDKPQRENQHNKEQTSPKSKYKPKPSEIKKQSKKNKPVLQSNNSNLNNTVEPVQNISFTSGRPVRSCRTSSQNRSQLNTSVDMNKSLRSRVINLSSSIENITIKIKPKNKNNKNISQMVTRKSDVSYSLRSRDRDQTPIFKKNSARSRADQRKRKT